MPQGSSRSNYWRHFSPRCCFLQQLSDFARSQRHCAISGPDFRRLTSSFRRSTMYPDRAMIKLQSNPDALMGWMDSLADQTRLRLLRLLERHELGVVELCDVLQLPQSTVSRHLKVLTDEGWAQSRRQATTHLYRMILDELDSPQRKLWLLAREQTDEWPQVGQDRLRLTRLLRQRAINSQEFFSGAAGRWDKLRRELYGENFTTAALLALL